MLSVTRMDLDGAGSPSALVTKILRSEPTLTVPIPIEALAGQLDIAEIRPIAVDGFEGGLITDAGRSSGFILVNQRAHPTRQRFTIGHELGHFLLTHHRPRGDQGFLCSREDMRRYGRGAQSPAIQMEVEANQFSALLLMPPPLWRKSLERFRDPSLDQINELSREYLVSKEAAARSFVDYHSESIAIVVARHGTIERIYRPLQRFPALCVEKGHKVPRSSLFHRLKPELGKASDLVEAQAQFWLETEWGRPIPQLCEQVAFQQNGYAMILLWAEQQDEEDDREDNLTSAQRYKDRMDKWNGHRR